MHAPKHDSRPASQLAGQFELADETNRSRPRHPKSRSAGRQRAGSVGAPSTELFTRRSNANAGVADGAPGRGRRANRSASSSLLRPPLVEAPLHVTALRRESCIRLVLSAADVLAAGLALVLVGVLFPAGSILAPPALVMLPLVVLLARTLGLYHKDEIRLRQSTLDEAPALFQLATLFALGVWVTRHAMQGNDLTGSHVMTLLVVFFVLVFCCRLVARVLGGVVLSPERCLVIGSSDATHRLARALDVAARSSVVAASIVCDTAAAEEQRFTELADREDLTAVVEAAQVDRVIIAPRYPVTAQVVSLVHTAKAIGVRVTVVPFLGEIMGASAEVESIGGVTVLGLPRLDLSASARATKRAVDLVGATIGLLFVGPVMLAVALWVKIDSPGPVLFRQLRMGRDGKPFEILKFRSMVSDAEVQKAALRPQSEAVGLFKISDDPRITRIGHILRRTSLDELPQLWNVLRGDMSLVGPRPLVLDEDEKIVGWFRHRLHLQPGITGHWQVLGSARIPLDDMIRIDYLYVANWSLWGDIKLLLQTVPYVIARKGL
jgi:exopolysaccharide biosynthesis polyprenyl glycosylphosphotransferase